MIISPKVYKGQERTYYMGGSASVKFDFQNQPLMSFQPPSVKVGCSGIDLVMGGFSFLNFEYLVQKLQGILSAAPAFAFQIALKTLCEACSDTITALEHITDMINQLNIDSCKASAALGGFVGTQVGKIAAKELGTGSSPAWFKSITDTINGPTGLYEKFQNSQSGENGIDYWACIGKGGSKETCSHAHGKVNFTTPLMTQVFNEFVQYPSLKDFEPMYRATFGDVYQPGSEEHKKDDPKGQSIPGIKGDPGCSGNDLLINGMVSGKYKEKSKADDRADSPNCKEIDDTSKGLYEKVKTSLKRIEDNARAGTEPTQTDIDLINASRVPIYKLISLGVLVEKLGGDDGHLFTDLMEAWVADALSYDIAFSITKHIHRSAINTLAAIKAMKSDNDPDHIAEFTIQGMIVYLGKDLEAAQTTVTSKWEAFRTGFGDAYEKEGKMSAMIYQYLAKNKLMDSYLYAKGLR